MIRLEKENFELRVAVQADSSPGGVLARMRKQSAAYEESDTARELEQLREESQASKKQNAALRRQLESVRSELTKLQAILKRYRRIVQDFESCDSASRNAGLRRSNSALTMLTEQGEPEYRPTAGNDISGMDRLKKCQTFQGLLDEVKRAQGFPEIVSLCIKYCLRGSIW